MALQGHRLEVLLGTRLKTVLRIAFDIPVSAETQFHEICRMTFNMYAAKRFREIDQILSNAPKGEVKQA